MNRRDLLLGVSVSALAVMLPLPAVASVPVFDYDVAIDKIELVNQAFNILEEWQFSLSEKANAFGFFPYNINDLASLRDTVLTYVIDYKHRDHWGRVQMITGIKQKLDEQFGEDSPSAQLEWMAGEHEWRHVRTGPRERMTSGHYMDIYYEARALGVPDPV